MSKKVTFTLPANVVANATSGIILGEFNNWNDSQAPILKKQKDGSMKATLQLEGGKTYQYRYLLNDGRWVNDNTANGFVPVLGYHVENCVISVPAEEIEVAQTAVETSTAATPTTSKDDLTKIEGIGKKIAEIVAAAGITGFEDLAVATPKKLKTILEAAGNKFRMHNPATWPKQSKLAAAGKWTELKKLQASLKGGK
ncbi:MAG: helix-hairpin-helix domain-containing protein [Bacteroidota bacterium]